jgi:hypothetical protein
VARVWNEQLLDAIRIDFARPTVHARNLYHVSVAMWDAWAAYDPAADCVLHEERLYKTSLAADNLEAARAEAISYAAYRVLSQRFANSPGAARTLPALDLTMAALGYDTGVVTTEGTTPAALGNRIAQAILEFGRADGSNEENDYQNSYYQPVNPPLLPDFPGNPDIVDPNRWQPLALEFFIDQSGNPIADGFPEFLSPEWGVVDGFALSNADRVTYPGPDDFQFHVFHDPGPPPRIGGVGDQAYKDGFKQVLEFSGYLDPNDGVRIDISPAARGNNTLGTNDGHGHQLNPMTGQPYQPQFVLRGDYTRILAEFWADGPDSETPPGHWFTILNLVSDQLRGQLRLGGHGPAIEPLEWDVKAYLTMGGAMHDAAIAAWGVKGYYDYIRPIQAIRYMADRGQSSDPLTANYHPHGLPLEPGMIELVTEKSSRPRERHAHLADHIGEIAVRSWRGHVEDPASQYAGVGWILARDWWPYQRPTFVTPPFAGYVSGHSTFSRAAAEVMTLFTGSEFFPGGLGSFQANKNQFLVFEQGPSEDVTLQWATYYDAADECSLSRIYGGIHPTADDIPGRLMGSILGPDAFARAQEHFFGLVTPDIFADGFERRDLSAWPASVE